MKELVWLDLCSGLGGASQPALDRGWRVIRVDIESKFKPDIVADVRSLPLKPFHVDVLWASPPCQEFSKRYLPWFSTKGLPDPPTELIECLQSAIKSLRPRYWIIENVRGARKWLTPILGRVLFCSTGHALWGQAPVLLPNIPPQKGSLGYQNGSRTKMGRRGGWAMGSGGGKDGHRRNSATIAKIPYAIGEAICIAVERAANGD